MALQGEFEYEYVTYTGRNVINETLRVLTWFARTGVSVHIPGRASKVEQSKGMLVIIGDADKMFETKVGLRITL